MERSAYQALRPIFLLKMLASFPSFRNHASPCPVLSVCQVLPKHTLEAVLICLCAPNLERDVEVDGRNKGPDDDSSSRSIAENAAGSCVWTELTMPVITAILTLKPALSDNAITVLVRRVEAASEQPQLQVGADQPAHIKGHQLNKHALGSPQTLRETPDLKLIIWYASAKE